MKKIVLLIFLNYLLSSVGSAQFSVYHPFPHNNAFWLETEWWLANGCNNMPTVSVYNHFDYYVNGDTIVRGNRYTKVHISGGYEDAPPCPPPVVWQSYDGLACLMREDTVAGKVYVSLPPAFATDTLLYDFTLKQGDYMPKDYLVRMDSTFVYSIDSVLVGNSYRKQFVIARIKSAPQVFDNIIEGIGAETGLLQPIVPSFESGSGLDCFDNTATNIVYPKGNSCSRFYLSVPEIKNELLQVSVYPNPNNGNFTLEYNLGTQANGVVRIFNMYGQLVGEYSLANSQGKMSISNPELSNGIYIWKVYANDQPLKVGKVVIMK